MTFSFICEMISQIISIDSDYCVAIMHNVANRKIIYLIVITFITAKIWLFQKKP